MEHWNNLPELGQKIYFTDLQDNLRNENRFL